MATGKPVQIWVVDDAEAVRKSLAAALESNTLTVREYPDASSFLAEYQPGRKGCLILDQHMPGMTGLELLQRLSATPGAPPTIAITGHGDAELKKRLMAAGASMVLDKPVDADELIGMIDRLMLNVA